MRAEQRWRLARFVPTAYDFVIEHERLAGLGGRLLWGADVGPMYRGFASVRELPPDATVLDVPCGGGVAFRGLPGDGRGPRYVAADLSPVMLARARAEAARRGLTIGFTRADVARLPFRDGAFDLILTYNGLHCLPDPAAALVEMARVLRPGGTLSGTAVVTGAGPRQDLLVALFRRRGEFATVGRAADLRAWLEAAGLENVRLQPRGALAYFTAARPA